VSYLIDTNVISELRKRERGDPGVVRWAAPIQPSELYTSVLVIGRFGVVSSASVEPTPGRRPFLRLGWKKCTVGLGAWVLPVDNRVGDVSGRLGIPDPLPPIDALIAATALAYDFTVVTRNTDDLVRAGVKVFNKFSLR